MNMTSSRRGDVLIVPLDGRLDAVDAPDMSRFILGLIDAGNKKLVIDLTRLDYISSAGLQVFVQVAKRLRTEGGELRLCAPSEQVRRVFDIAGLSLRMDMLASVDEAVRRFGTA
jgi:anti-anti-sigma factor